MQWPHSQGSQPGSPPSGDPGRDFFIPAGIPAGEIRGQSLCLSLIQYYYNYGPIHASDNEDALAVAAILHHFVMVLVIDVKKSSRKN